MGIEIIIVIIIIFVVVFLVGGNSLPFFDEVVAHRLNAHQWDCQPAIWEKDPQYKQNKLSGIISLSCQIERESQDHMSHLVQKVSTASYSAAHDVTHQTSSQENGLYTQHVEGFYQTQTSTEKIYSQGQTHIVSDQRSYVRATHQAKKITGPFNSRYVRAVNTQLSVTTHNKFHQVRITNEIEVQKPWFVFARPFKSLLKQQLTEALNQRAENIANQISAGLK